MFWIIIIFLSISAQQYFCGLEKVLENQKLKFIFFSGKGGVGKTTVSSAFSIQLASKSNGKVLLISTDPAHSLSDAFLVNFTSQPTLVEGALNLYVMEINPQAQLEKEIKVWANIAKDVGFELAGEFQKLQQWITSIPGIDEATALASVIGYIESGEFSTIVFDTAPTGHTLKLLQLPEVLQAGLTQLDSWQSKLWGYYESFSALMGGGQGKNNGQAKRRLQKKLKDYKVSIDKVASMIKNKRKTTFVTVCIAEYLSISETTRLLSQLNSQNIHYSHVVVNQLIRDSPTLDEIEQINAFLTAASTTNNDIRLSTFLTHSRNKIQSKYLSMLRDNALMKDIEIVQVPLLNTEVTGVTNLIEFSSLLFQNRSEQNEATEL